MPASLDYQSPFPVVVFNEEPAHFFTEVKVKPHLTDDEYDRLVSHRSIGGFCREKLLHTSAKYEVIAAWARKKFGSDTTKECVASYASRLRNDYGYTVPENWERT